MEKYEMGPEIGSGNFGVAKMMTNKETGEIVAVKFLDRGGKIDERVGREIVNHRSLWHPNIIRFKEIALTPRHLAIVMEFAPCGDLFDYVLQHGALSEGMARFFFSQLISGVGYCHSMQICHRDLKLENTLLTGSMKRPQLKICDFGYSKSSLLHSKPNSRLGSPSYIAPEIIASREYDGKPVDVWSCGVCLYVMIFGKYPFEDEAEPNNVRKTIARIMDVRYRIPSDIPVSKECRHLFYRIFIANPYRRITVDAITRHPWFVKDLPPELFEALPNSREDGFGMDALSYGHQSVEDIMKIVKEAGTVPAVTSEDGDLITL